MSGNCGEGGARQRFGADTTRIKADAGDREPRGKRSRELLMFIREEVKRTGSFPDHAAMMAAMQWRDAASVEDALLRLIAAGFITREVTARKYTRRTYAHRLVERGSAGP